jgi:hypothetical protein
MHTHITAGNQLEKLRLDVERFRLRLNIALTATGCPGRAIVGIIRCHDSLKDKVQAASKELDSVLVELRRLTFVGASSGGYIRRNRPCHGEKRKIALPESPSRLQSWNA